MTRSRISLVLIVASIVSVFAIPTHTQVVQICALFALAIGLSLRVPLRFVGGMLVPCVLYLGLWGIFGVLRGYCDETPWAASTRLWVADIERSLFGTLPSATLQDRFFSAAAPSVIDPGLYAVYYSFFVVPMLVAALLIVRNRQAFWFNWLTLLVLESAALVVHALIPTSPPWIADATVIKAKTFISIFGKPAASVSGSGGPLGIDTNPFAAMPSVHTAVTVALAVTAWRYGGAWLKAISIGYSVAMAVCLVYFGEHYILDVAIGALLAIGSGRAAQALMSNPGRATQLTHWGVLKVRGARLRSPEQSAAPFGLGQAETYD